MKRETSSSDRAEVSGSGEILSFKKFAESVERPMPDQDEPASEMTDAEKMEAYEAYLEEHSSQHEVVGGEVGEAYASYLMDIIKDIKQGIKDADEVEPMDFEAFKKSQSKQEED